LTAVRRRTTARSHYSSRSWKIW